MTLMDAPKYDAVRERRHKHIVMVVFLLAVLSALGTWWFWNWPEEHHVNTFVSTVESGDLTKAYGIWTQDQDWQQHPERYKAYGFDRFQQDWGVGSQYGRIHSYKFVLSRSWGNGVITGLISTTARLRFSCGWIARPKRSVSPRWNYTGPYGIRDGIQ